MLYKKGLSSKNKYRILLITILCFTLFAPLSVNFSDSRWIYTSLFALLVSAISLNVNESRTTAWILPACALIAICAYFLQSEATLWLMINKISALAFFVYAAILFGKNIFADDYHHHDHIYGSICVYLFIGISYSYVFMILSLIDPMSLIYLSNNTPIISQFDFYYFSFVTLTTVGFGDIVASHSMTKAIVILESITGIFYLAVLVANLISLHSIKQR